MRTKSEYIPADRFHTQIKRVFSGEYHWAVNKKNEQMAHVVYDAVHENKLYEDERRGRGKDFATWIFSEEEGLQENIFSSGFELMIDARLEPDAAIGLHTHSQTEEIYYILEGTIRMTTVAADGQQLTAELNPGDAHAVKVGQSHYGIAGPQGVRFIAVAMRPTF